jgi:hypothetical protein
MTRQRRWQIKMVRERKCKICGAPAVTKFLCEKHRLAANTRTREAMHKRNRTKRRYAGAEYAGGSHATTIFHFPKWLRGVVCSTISPADRELFLQATRSRERTDRPWQIRHTSGKAIAGRDKEPASHAYGGKPKSAALSLSPPRARESSIGKGFIRKGDPPPPALRREAVDGHYRVVKVITHDNSFRLCTGPCRTTWQLYRLQRRTPSITYEAELH